MCVCVFVYAYRVIPNNLAALQLRVFFFFFYTWVCAHLESQRLMFVAAVAGAEGRERGARVVDARLVSDKEGSRTALG